MDILGRVGRGEWVVIGSVEVDTACTYQGCMSSGDRFAVDEFEGYLFADTDKTFSAQCFDDRGNRICTAAEAKRMLKEKIIEALSA